MIKAAAMKVRGSAGVRPRVGLDGSGGEKRGGDAEDYADGEEEERFFEDHPEDAVRLCAESEADADLVGAADDVVGHDSVEADGGDYQGEEGEDCGEGRQQFFVSDGMGDLILNGGDVEQGEIWVGGCDGGAQVGDGFGGISCGADEDGAGETVTVSIW